MSRNEPRAQLTQRLSSLRRAHYQPIGRKGDAFMVTGGKKGKDNKHGQFVAGQEDVGVGRRGVRVGDVK